MGFKSRIEHKQLSAQFAAGTLTLEQIAKADDPGSVVAHKQGFLGGHQLKKDDLARQRQIDLANAAAANPAIKAIIPQLQMNWFAGHDALQAAFFQKKQLEGKPLSAAEKLVVDALDGKHIEAAETLHWKNFLTPGELAQTPRAGNSAPLEQWAVSGTFLPPLLLYAAHWFVGFGGAAFAVSMFASLGISATLGRTLIEEAQKVKGDFGGVNALEGVEVENELLRLHEHLASGEHYQGSPESIVRQMQTDVALIGALLQLRREAIAENHKEETPREKAVVAAFESFAAKIGALAPQPVDDQVIAEARAARAELLKSMKAGELKSMAAGIRPKPVVKEKEFLSGINALVGVMVDNVALTANPALTQLVKHLEKQHDLEKHLDKKDAPRLSEAEIEAIGRHLSPELTLQELLCVAKLIHSGAVTMHDFWPGIDKKLEAGETFDYRKATEDIIGLYKEVHRGDAAKETIGKALPVLGWLVGLVGMGWAAFSGDVSMMPWGMAAGYGPPMLSHVAGYYLEKSGKNGMTIGGSDLAKGEYVTSIHERVLSDLQDPHWLMNYDDADKMRAGLKEAVASLRVSLDAQPESAKMRGAQQGAPPSTLDQIYGYADPQAPSLKAFVAQLDAISNAQGDVDTLRGQVLGAWSKLMSKDIWSNVQKDVLGQCATDEVSSSFAHLASKRRLLQTLGAAIQNSAKTGQPIENQQLLPLAQQARHALVMRNQKEDSKTATALEFIPIAGPLIAPAFKMSRAGGRIDPIDDLALYITKNQGQQFDGRLWLKSRTTKEALKEAPTLDRLALEVQTLLADNELDLKSTPVLTPERMSIIPKEAVDVVYDRILSLYYGERIGGLEAPKVEALEVTPITSSPGWAQISARIGGKNADAGDGKMNLVINLGQGNVDVDQTKIDVGERATLDFAKRAVAMYLGVQADELKRVKTSIVNPQKIADDDFDAVRTVLVRTKNHGNFTIDMDANGFARFDTLRKAA